ncbi:MAG: transcriptional repressor [Candidatus Uhrbacteria bacterium]|nr:transcriptional repressor [Candidatus Uhrbacteria bacterium]
MKEHTPASQSLRAELADEGIRMTKLRSALIELFASHKKPFSMVEIQHALKKKRIPNHRVTLYRELEFLTKTNVIHPILFHDGTRRYEFVELAHHHHLVCLKCEDVQDVELETELDKEEERIERKTKFHIIRHSLEFFGLCANCR